MDKLTASAIISKHYLTKSDFKVARECPVKLYYKKMGYPTNKESNEYLQMLAEGGYMVGKLAQLLHPGGIEVGYVTEPLKAVEQTEELLKQDKVILFEPAIYHEHMLVRADILIKDGNRFEIIEVKSKSYISDLLGEEQSGGDSVFRNKRDGSISAGWRPYLEDVAYQAYVLKQKFPGAEIRSFLMMPDKGKNTNIEGLPGLFRITELSDNKKYKQLNVDFTGEIKDLLKDDILTKTEVTGESEELGPAIRESLQIFIPAVKDGIIKISCDIDKDCKKCEFRASQSDTRDGFRECWGALADVTPHIFDLYHIGTLQKGELADRLIRQGKVSMFDITEEDLSKKRGIRQGIQIRHTLKNEEWFAEGFRESLKKYSYPLHFIDFETSALALPYHKGMRPYESVVFQWSLHTIHRPGAEEEHREWINTEETFPNFMFAETLMNALGDTGTVFMWHHYERTKLRDIYRQMDKYGYDNTSLKAWLERVADPLETGQDRLTDMCDMCLKNYFHPEMKGSTSLKHVLPAIWNINKRLHEHSLFCRYYKKENNRILNPYDTLPVLDIMEQGEVIKEGGGAMMAYQEMMYGLHRDDPVVREQWKNLLLQYCELDTAAMVMVWYHWNGI